LLTSFFTPQNYGRLLLEKANSLPLHVIAQAFPKAVSMTHFDLPRCIAQNP
jgi:hypothetical protein